jgi:hypothetical protein
MNPDKEAAHILALERAAMDRWGNGDPSGFLELSSPDVTYFDPYIERRLDGLEALTRRYEELRGKVHIDHCEFIQPKVQFCGDASAVLTYNFVSHSGDIVDRWNCTEVYQRTKTGWEIIQTHWSYTCPAP